jgi:hypothetical protein
MKCPKCGFNSFEFLDNCKKCNTSLTPFKNNLGIRAVVLQPSRYSSSGTGAESGPVTIVSGEASSEERFSWENPPEKRPFEATDSVDDFEMDLSDLQEGIPAAPLYTKSPANSTETENIPDPISTGEAEGALALADSPVEGGFEDLIAVAKPESDWNGQSATVGIEQESPSGINELFESFRNETPVPESSPQPLPSLEEVFSTDASDAATDKEITKDNREKDPILDDLESLFELNETEKK